MNRVKIADLKNNLSRHLMRVRSGGEIVVLDRNTPVARIVPFDRREPGRDATPEGDAYWSPDLQADLERRGVLQRGRPKAVAKWLGTTRPLKLPPGSPSAVALLLEARRGSSR